MADINDVKYDMNLLTLAEYRKFARGGFQEEADDEILARVTGIPVDDIRALSFLSYRRLVQGFFAAATGKLDDPN